MKKLLYIFFFSSAALFNGNAKPNENPSTNDKPNILMIICDDLNHWVGHFGRNNQIKTPHIDALARQGISFTNAYCASPQCNPSRASFFSGKRPFSSGVYANGTLWQRGISPSDLLTSHFDNNGYYVAGAGKIHGSVVKALQKKGRYAKRGPLSKARLIDQGKTAAQTWGILDGDDDSAEDEKTVRWITEQLKAEYDQPFFLMAGLYKPHLKWNIPKKYYDMYPLEEIQLPPVQKGDLDDIDMNAVFKIAGGPKVSTKNESDEDLKKMVRAYMAAVSYCDAQVGRILKALNESKYKHNTIIMLWGDHGYHLGEKFMAAKRLLWEEATRAPYIWVAPGITEKGVVTDRVVDFMTAYPTLCDLAGLPIPGHVSGKSIAHLLADPGSDWHDIALSTYWPGNHTVRTKQWRYIRYDNGSEELYDKKKDEFEWKNLIDDPQYKNVIQRLSDHLPKVEVPMVKNYMLYPEGEDAIHINDLIVHDPCILADRRTGTYYIYSNFAPNKFEGIVDAPKGKGGIMFYASKDLIKWSRPKPAFIIPDDFWGDDDSGPWAPEVHEHQGNYYMFTTFNAWGEIMDTRRGRPKITKRASQILVSDSPMGPFTPFKNQPSTPEGEMTLDATFWYEDGQPWMIYCHEWVQLGNGLIKAIRLSDDLSKTVGEPVTLLNAADVPWTKRNINYKGTRYPGAVTDGPYFYKTKEETLIMIWSSWSAKRQYATAMAVSQSGKITGPWKHVEEPLLQDDRGHGMIFRDFDDRLILCLHRYFKYPHTRVQLYELQDTGTSIKLKQQLSGHK